MFGHASVFGTCDEAENLSISTAFLYACMETLEWGGLNIIAENW